MIPKPLNEIEWADLEALSDSGREEDDTIEYKASFSGGSDYLTFSGAALEKAQRGIVREAIAFLNSRGGDIVIGAKETSNEAPTIGEFIPLENVSITADRLAQSITALIEPHQSVLGVKAIKYGDTETGVIIIRAPSSLRAPHRFTRDKECYIRRGRETVPMPMDEVQDLTIRRSDLRNERLQTLASMFEDLDSTLVGRTALSDHRFHIRLAFLPLRPAQIEIHDGVLAAMRGSTPELTRGTKLECLDVPFRNLGHRWEPVLRGRRIANLANAGTGEEDFIFCAKEIRSNGSLITDFACRISLAAKTDSPLGLYHDWLAGYLANTLTSFGSVWNLIPQLGEALVRVALRSAGSIASAVNQGMWGNEYYYWPQGVVALPDFPVSDGENFIEVLQQSQLDLAAILGFEPTKTFRIPPST